MFWLRKAMFVDLILFYPSSVLSCNGCHINFRGTHGCCTAWEPCELKIKVLLFALATTELTFYRAKSDNPNVAQMQASIVYIAKRDKSLSDNLICWVILGTRRPAWTALRELGRQPSMRQHPEVGPKGGCYQYKYETTSNTTNRRGKLTCGRNRPGQLQCLGLRSRAHQEVPEGSIDPPAT
jgi:hypothetical protein